MKLFKFNYIGVRDRLTNDPARIHLFLYNSWYDLFQLGTLVVLDFGYNNMHTDVNRVFCLSATLFNFHFEVRFTNSINGKQYE